MASQSTQTRTSIVMIVEDEEDTADLIKLLLERARHQVLHVQDGQRAQELIDFMPPPDLILLDVMLPVLSGLDLLAYIKKQLGWEQVPIAMLTANGTTETVKRALALGANDYIRKPFDPQQLMGRVNHLLNSVS